MTADPADARSYGPQNAAERDAADEACREAVALAVLAHQAATHGRRLNRNQREGERRAVALARWLVDQDQKRGTP
jgi:hypothetical protein